MHIVVAAAPAFLASVVEFVEALTIVLAVGVTRQWRSTLIGVGAAVLALAVLVGTFGTAIAVLVPIDLLRLVVGGFLVIYGLGWLTKAVLRAGGAKAKHDEAAIYQRQIARLTEEPPVPARGMDWISFTVAFKGVLLEGLEVVFIVITFGDNQKNIGAAVIGAAAAVIVVTVTGIAVRAPLTKVPENWMKFAVGVMLTSFGTFWGAEGAGVAWPGNDAALLVIVPLVALAGAACIFWLRSRKTAAAVPVKEPEAVA